ncbi:zinc ribbon domain-containing protein YjdM [Hutsoniella sourekii]|uniref:zinc ribbon domain-containing protein YjdM n=1 Tax=Hutsoniella sourekii TaxID=87650 RepID=UPI0004844613|nr:zinc ribbon domain-containing protein YjdM [Hutsoniella sourekii]
MSTLPACPNCHEDMTYTDGVLLICPMCGHEWSQEEEEAKAKAAAEASLIRDANGNILEDGDSVTVIQDLKLSATQTIKQGTKVKNIRLVQDPIDGHDIDCKIDGFGKVMLKSSVVKK